MESNDDKRDRVLNLLGDFFLFVIIMTAIICCSGCTTARPVVLERVSHDTVHATRLHLDSILLRDSVYFETIARGDTVYLTKHVTHWRDRVSVLRDTIFAIRERATDVPVSQQCKAMLADRLLSPTALRMAVASVLIATLIWLYHRKR